MSTPAPTTCTPRTATRAFEPTTDEPLLEHTDPTLARPLPVAIVSARADILAERLAATPDGRLNIPTRWSRADVSLGFRFGRCASHLREHTIQVEKTLSMLDHVPDERAWLVRHVLAAYGRAEAVVFGRADADEAAERIAQAAAEGREAIRAARAAPGP